MDPRAIIYIEYAIMILSILIMGMIIRSRVLYSMSMAMTGSIIFIRRLELIPIVQLWIILWQATYVIPKLETVILKKLLGEDRYYWVYRK
jgi:hypothetical protein